MASEEGEILAKEEPSRNNNGVDDEVVAAAVIDDGDSEGSEEVVAAVIEDEPAAVAAPAAAAPVEVVVSPPETTTTDSTAGGENNNKPPVKKEQPKDDEEEDGEVVESRPPVEKKAVEASAAVSTEATPPAASSSSSSSDPTTKKKDSIDSEVSANKPAEKAVKTEGDTTLNKTEADQPPTTNKKPKPPPPPPPKDKKPKDKDASTTKKEATPDVDVAPASAAKDGKPKEAVVDRPPPPPPPPKKKQKADMDEGEEGEIEEGEVDDPTPPPPKSAPKALPEETPSTKKPSPGGSKKSRPKDKDKAAEGDKKEGAVDKEEPKVSPGKNKDAEMDTVVDVTNKESSNANSNNNIQKKDGISSSSKKKKKKSAKQHADNNKDVPPATKDKDKPTPMEMEELKSKVSESSSDAKKGDDEDEAGEIKEDGELDTESDNKEDTEEEGEIKEDLDMQDALSQSEEGGDRDVDMASVDGDDASVVDGSSAAKKPEPSYSTRGRASGTTTPVPRDATAKSSSLTAATAASAGNNEQWQRSVREALENLGRGSSKEGTPAGVGPGGASFLEALGEEERRTRTRFLPAVDGIHMLRKNEIKGDLALARSIMSSAGTVANVASVAAGASASLPPPKKSKKKKHDGEGDPMETEDGEAMSSSEEDPSMDGSRVGSASTIDVDVGDILMVPSTAFVPPPAATHSSNVPASSNGEKHEEGAPPVPSGVKGILNNQRNIKSPRVVESVTAFNPPRPPESVGKKKQHRMLRWERRPADVELDLNSYRKTVDRTRKELQTEEAELERIEATSNHLRRHFLAHLRCMDGEMDQIMSELNVVQQKCVNAADLLTSRTRSRGAGKGSYVMRDVLTVLKARGAELDEKGLSLRGDVLSSSDNLQNYPGIGGVGASSFADWNEKSSYPHQPIASSWVLPDDKVETPYGDGVVTGISESAISVRLPFGVGHFNPGTVTSKESPNVLTDARLSKRWKGMIDSAVVHSGRPDLNAMASVETLKVKQADHHDKSKEGAANGGAGHSGDGRAWNDQEQKEDAYGPDDTKLLPFGSTLLPTASGRGNNLCNLSSLELEKEFKPLLIDGMGVLGSTANEAVPTEVKDFEANTQESYILQAKVLQLRNQLYRQRRIRTLNDRTFTATRDRSIRVEGLVQEMRTDLKSLKFRLDEELKELGIDQDRAEAILKNYYTTHDYGEHELDDSEARDGSPSSKRSRDDDSKSDPQSPASQPKASSNGVSDAGGEKQTKRLKVASQ